MTRSPALLLALPIALLSGCSKKPSRVHAVKFRAAAGSDEGAYVIMFSEPRHYRLEAFVVSGGKSELAWTGYASPTPDGILPFAAITTYGNPSDKRDEVSRLHFRTSTQEQHILDLPQGEPWFARGGLSSSISGRTIVYHCSVYPEGSDSNPSTNDGQWLLLEDYEARSAKSGWKYVVVTCEETAEPSRATVATDQGTSRAQGKKQGERQ